MNEIPVTLSFDDVTFKLKEYQDFEWLVKLGRVFTVFDQQDSGNICFGIEIDGQKRFVKYAGAKTIVAWAGQAFSCHHTPGDHADMWIYCRQLSFLISFFFQSGICIEGIEAENRQCEYDQERIGDCAVYDFYCAYHQHDCYLSADTTCAKQAAWF